MRVKTLGTRPAPASLRELFAQMVWGRAPAISVERRAIPYWRERGWSRRGDTYTGAYQTPYAAYAVSSWFLHDCFRKLTADADEQFFFVTGAEVDSVLVLDQCAEIAHQRRSRMGVVADMPSTHNLLIRLEEFGHRFLAHFHSHPGNGPGATQPSGTDENFQRRLEQGGHVAVMAIFSRDGFVRFVRLNGAFEIAIHGEGVERHAPHVYQLTNIG
jgi:hypothetical protein